MKNNDAMVKDMRMKDFSGGRKKRLKNSLSPYDHASMPVE
jgi:hypothetical protein